MLHCIYTFMPLLGIRFIFFAQVLFENKNERYIEMITADSFDQSKFMFLFLFFWFSKQIPSC